MATSATLKAAGSGYPGHAHSIASIPLNKLVPWDGNVRKTGGNNGLEELTASIAALGVLQSLVVRKANRGKFAIVAGRRRFLALSALAEGGAIDSDAPVPCRIIPGSADATEISLAENVVRAPMHPADQFEAFKSLIDGGSTVADIAARFGISEVAVKKRLKLARVSPTVVEAYRVGDLTLEQVQAFAVSDDQSAQERVFGELSNWNSDPDDIRQALTRDEIPGTDKRARFVTIAAYEEAGGPVRRDLFTEGDNGVFILDAKLLDRLALEKLQSAAEAIRTEGWKWVEAHPEFGYETRSRFQRRRPEPLPLSDEAAAESKALAGEYHDLFEGMEDDNEEALERLDAIEARINELEDTKRAFTPETLGMAGSVVTLGQDGNIEVVRGLVRPEDMPEESARSQDLPREKPAFSASLIESLTTQKSAAISASLSERPDIALASVVHALACGVFRSFGNESALQLTARTTHLRETCKGKELLEQARDSWSERVRQNPQLMWEWCLAQDKDTLLELLAFCAASTIDGIQRKQDRPDCRCIAHANALAAALNLDMKAWFTPTAGNYFSRVSRAEILSALLEANGTPARRSWDKLKKSDLATLAEREIAGKPWLPQILRA